jgi:signal transduction histidine kinase
MVTIEFSDNEPGIPDELLERAFEPFYTTKEAGKGTGLGLSISASIISEHKGTIRVESSPPGVKFIITLPSL